jgi:hypothetical protein
MKKAKGTKVRKLALRKSTVKNLTARRTGDVKGGSEPVGVDGAKRKPGTIRPAEPVNC